MLRILYATYESPESFLQHVHVEEDKDASFVSVATKAEFSEKEPVILEIGYPGLPNRILLRANAAASPDEDEEHKWFQVDFAEELQLDFLIAIASGRAEASVQRRHRRFPLRMEARVKVEGDEEAAPQEAQTADMATGGVAIETDEPLPDGARVTVMLNPGDGSPEIEISGTVVWNREGEFETAEVGIQFEKTSTEHMKRLRQLIRGVKLSGEHRGGV